MSRSLRIVAGATLFGALSLGLVGCGSAVEQLVQEGTEQAVERAIEESTGGQVDIDTGEGASLPADWPDLPVPEGKITLATSVPDGMTVAFTTTQAEADAVLEKLLSSGFTEDSRMDAGGGEMVLLTGAEWNVMLSWVAEGDTPDSVLLSYVVTPVTP